MVFQSSKSLLARACIRVCTIDHEMVMMLIMIPMMSRWWMMISMVTRVAHLIIHACVLLHVMFHVVIK